VGGAAGKGVQPFSGGTSETGIAVRLGSIEHAAEVQVAEQDFVKKDDVARLMRAIDTLPQKERFAIILRDIEEMPTEEVASILGSSPATVRVQISNARAKIRKFMESGQ